MSELNVKQESGDGSVTITDSKGRKLTLKEPDFILESRITKECGDASTNVGYMYGYVFPAIWCTKIDGDNVPFPTTFREVEGLIGRLGREGNAAILEYQKKIAEEEKNQDVIKN